MRTPGLLLDLDGTLFIGTEWIPGARQALERLRRQGHPIVFVSNTLDWAEDIVARLNDTGLPTPLDDIIHVPRVLSDYLNRHFPGAAVNVIGERSLVDQLRPHVRLSLDPDEIEVVVASADLAFDFSKLTVAFLALRRGARLVATNTDATWPGPSGPVPDTGAILGAIEGCTGRRPEAVVGKPSRSMAEAALRRLGLPAHQVWVVGDSLATDVRMARQVGMTTVLVLTGVTRRDELAAAAVRPHHVLEAIAELPDLISSLADV
ncbi:MAG: HAD-IIA family hydrolase [Chloroflexota bacterium]